MSRSLAWVPKGPALETYETKIRVDLEAVLANIELPEGAPLFLKLYMIGRDEGSANPMIMVCCVHRTIRNEAELAIRESHILDRFPGFGLGFSALLLESHGLEELLTRVRVPTAPEYIRAILTCFRGPQHGMGQSQSDEDLGASGNTLEIYGSFPHKLGGTIRFNSVSNGKVSAAHSATGGPILQLDTELYQITAGHGMRFGTPDARIHYSASELDECEFDGQSDFDDDSTTSPGSDTTEECSTQSSDEGSRTSRLSREEASKADQQAPRVPALHTMTQPDGNFPTSIVEAGSSAGAYKRVYLHFYNHDLDYALLKLPPQSGLSGSRPYWTPPRHGSRRITKTSQVESNNTRVLVVTPHGSIPGNISLETTSYKMRGFAELQRLLTVQLEGIFFGGFSGSAVVDFVTGAVYGQITIGSPGQSLAYCVPAPSIFADIFSRTGHVPILDESHWQINSLERVQGLGVPQDTQHRPFIRGRATRLLEAESNYYITK